MSLDKIYYDPEHTAAFSSVAKLVSAAKSNKKNVEKWLSGQDTYTLHKPVLKDFLAIHILLPILMMFGRLILQTWVPCRNTMINTNTF